MRALGARLRKRRREKQEREQRRSFQSFIHIETLVRGMRSVPDRAEPVKRGSIKAGGIAVGAAAGEPFLEIEADFCR